VVTVNEAVARSTATIEPDMRPFGFAQGMVSCADCVPVSPLSRSGTWVAFLPTISLEGLYLDSGTV
jgi:hypothetical protein